MTDDNNVEDTDSAESTETIPNLIGQLNDFAPSRRNFLSNAAKAGTGAAALGALGTGTAAAKSNSDDPSDSPYENRSPNGYGGLTDLQILKFALVLERLEATFYTEAVGDEPIGVAEPGAKAEGGRLSETAIERSDLAAQFANPSLRYATFQRFKQIRNHEQAHVDAVAQAVAAEGGSQDFASDLEFEFPYETAGEFITLARIFEDTGARTYPAAAPAIDNEEYLASAATIALIEGRHASFLRVLDSPLPFGSGSRNPFPEAFSLTLSLNTVVQAIEPFIVGVDVSDIKDLLG